MAGPLCYLNGKTLPLEDAKVGILDLGMLRGFGIYEGIAAIGGKPFHLHDHWERFIRSAQALGLSVPFSEADAERIIIELAGQNASGARASIRLVLTGGEAVGGLEHASGKETSFITAEPTIPLPADFYEKGAALITYEHQRALPEYKTINYITAVMLQPKRKAANAVEVLFVHGGNILECATSNIFIAKDGAVLTPKDGVLPGITRKIVLGLASEAYPVEEREISIDELFAADEVFITSSFKDIVPVREIDGRAIGTGAPGPITRDLMMRFATVLKPIESVAPIV